MGRIDNNSEETLKLKLLYTYKLIPAAFLEVEFPSFHYPVMFQEQAYATSNDVGLTNKPFNTNPNSHSSSSKMQMDSFDDVILYNDPDTREKHPDPL